MFRGLVRVVGNEGNKLLVARQKIGVGEVVLSERATCILRHPTRYTLERSRSEHLLFDGPIRYCNHSFEPNAKASIDDDVVSLVAVQAVEEGAQVTIDYTVTESQMAEPFVDSATGRLVK